MVNSSKLTTLEALVAQIPDGASVGLGGSFLHRGPFAFVRELIRQGKRDLEIIKASPGYDLDILCRAGCVARVRAGIVAMEGNFGLAAGYRKAIESGSVKLEEHACMTLTAGLRAAGAGVPFMPVGGVHGSQLPEVSGWKKITDPYGSGTEVWLIPAIQPDFAIIHAHAIDPDGNARVKGSPHWDRALTRAAKQVLVTSETVDSPASFVAEPELTLVPGFMVAAAAHVPQGAWPGSLSPIYEIDYAATERYVEESKSGDIARHMEAAPEVGKGSSV